VGLKTDSAEFKVKLLGNNISCYQCFIIVLFKLFFTSN